MAVALAWLLQRSPNVLRIPGTSSMAHLRENISGAALELPAHATRTSTRKAAESRASAPTLATMRHPRKGPAMPPTARDSRRSGRGEGAEGGAQIVTYVRGR